MNKFKSGDKVRVISDLNMYAKNRKSEIYTRMLGKIYTINKYMYPSYDGSSGIYSLRESRYKCVEWRLELVTDKQIDYIEDEEYLKLLV